MHAVQNEIQLTEIMTPLRFLNAVGGDVDQCYK